jgi:predicted permease
MTPIFRFLRKLGNQARRKSLRRELSEELALHADYKVRELTERGLPVEAAVTRMRCEMGNTTLALELSSDVRNFRFLEELMQDLRYALRLMMKQPALSLIVILSLALGIAGNAAVFSTVSALLLRPLPFQDPSRLVRITSFYPKALLVYFQQRCRSMDVASTSPGVELSVTGQGPAYRVDASATSANLFSVLGVAPQLGAGFEASDDQPGRDHVAIISYDMWLTRFHSDPTIINQVIRLNEVDRRIVGVMPAGFAFPSRRVQVWFPAALDPTNPDDFWGGEFVPLIARLKPGVTLEQAGSEVHALVAGVWTMFPFPMPRHWNSESTVIALQTDLAGDARGRVLILLGAVGAVLIIACANVASLLMARAMARRKEIALRVALGAGQGRIMRQLLTESVVLAVIAGAVGLVLAASALQTIRLVVPPDLPAAANISIDWRVVAFTAVVSVLAGLSFGFAPALTAVHGNLIGAVKASGQRSSTAAAVSLRNWMVGGEIALTVVLVIAAGLLIRSMIALSREDPGFKPMRVSAMRITPDPSFCKQPDACIASYEQLLEDARGLQGVVDAALANTVPMDGSLPSVSVDVEDHPKTADFPAPMFWEGAISPGYQRLMGIPLLHGRLLAASDTRLSEPVILVTASTAAHYWPSEDPIGKHVKMTWEKQWRRVVGVVADIHQYDLTNRTPASISGAMYLPYPQSVQGDHQIPSVMNLIVKVGRSAPRLSDDLSALATARDPGVPISKLDDLELVVRDSALKYRSTIVVFLSFAVAALFLATIGIYGMVAYAVSQRTYEISIRMAIGATYGDVVRLILSTSLRTTLLGTLAGLAGAFIMTRWLSSLLFEVTATDPAVFFAVPLFLISVALVASLIPAWRATKIEPARTLRAD